MVRSPCKTQSLEHRQSAGCEVPRSTSGVKGVSRRAVRRVKQGKEPRTTRAVRGQHRTGTRCSTNPQTQRRCSKPRPSMSLDHRTPRRAVRKGVDSWRTRVVRVRRQSVDVSTPSIHRPQSSHRPPTPNRAVRAGARGRRSRAVWDFPPSPRGDRQPSNNEPPPR